MRSTAKNTNHRRQPCVRSHELDAAKLNVGPFLHKMHALQWPDQHQIELPISMSGLWEGIIESPGAVMLDHQVSTPQKASAVRTNFLPLARWIDRGSDFRPGRVEKLQRFLVRHAIEDDRELWRDQHDNRLSVAAMLPPHEVVDAMFTSWEDHEASRCRTLEAFIGESLSRGVSKV